jgi:hypothetical protein
VSVDSCRHNRDDNFLGGLLIHTCVPLGSVVDEIMYSLNAYGINSGVALFNTFVAGVGSLFIVLKPCFAMTCRLWFCCV